MVEHGTGGVRGSGASGSSDHKARWFMGSELLLQSPATSRSTLISTWRVYECRPNYLDRNATSPGISLSLSLCSLADVLNL